MTPEEAAEAMLSVPVDAEHLVPLLAFLAWHDELCGVPREYMHFTVRHINTYETLITFGNLAYADHARRILDAFGSATKPT